MPILTALVEKIVLPHPEVVCVLHLLLVTGYEGVVRLNGESLQVDGFISLQGEA